MSYQNSFLALAQEKKITRKEKFLNEMDKIIPWNKFLTLIEPVYLSEAKTWRPKMELKMMLKIYFLQQWYNLSDPLMEEEIYNQNCFQKFLNIDLLSAKIPDETTILNFRHLLEDNKLQEKIFEQVNILITDKWYILKEWTIVDATIIEAPSSTKNKDKKRDDEMKSTKKWNNWFFWMKAHIWVDADSWLIHSLETTSANIHDSDKFEDCLTWEEKIILADKWYFNEERKKKARKAWIFCGILDKAKPKHKLSWKQKNRNKKLSSVRAKVEHPFQILKCQWWYTKTRYRWLQKNSAQLHTLFALINLFKVRKKLLLYAT